MTDQDEPQYRPGTVVNGHVLTQDGQWVPLHQPGQPPMPPGQPPIPPGQPPIPPGQPPMPPKREMSGWKKLGIVLGVIFLFFVGCGALLSGTSDTQDNATSQPTTAAQPAAEERPAEEPAEEAEKVATLGQPARDGNFEFVVTGVEEPVKRLGESFTEEEAQGEFVVVRVDVTNIGKDPRMLSSGSQYAYAGEARYADTMVIGLEGADRAFVENINPGNKVTGVPIVFDVPPGTKLTHVVLHDRPFSGGVKVNL